MERTPNENIEAIDESVDSAVGDDGGNSEEIEDDGRDEAVIAADDTGLLSSERATVWVEETNRLS